MSNHWVYDDGGRSAAGYRGSAGDCVTRSVAVATGLPYQEVYDALKNEALKERPRVQSNGRPRRRSSVRDGVAKPTIRRYLTALGWRWTPTMHIGSGTTVHVRADELPPGHLILSCSGHYTAMIDGVIHDTFDPSRDGTRCVYGYWQAPVTA